MSISSFFEKTLGANLTNARWSWGASNPVTNQIFLRVWEDQMECRNSQEQVLLMDKNWEGVSAGYSERNRHVEAIRNEVEAYGVLCTAKNSNPHGHRTIAKFDAKNLLRFGKIIENTHGTYALVIGRISTKALACPRTAYASILPDIKSLQRTSAKETSKTALLEARVGQGVFRNNVLSNWDRKCCVTQPTTLDAIRASHIKPWRDATDQERLDLDNGLPLVATLDALFDAG